MFGLVYPQISGFLTYQVNFSLQQMKTTTENRNQSKFRIVDSVPKDSFKLQPKSHELLQK